MAQRFGGKFSPDGSSKDDGAPPPQDSPFKFKSASRVGARSNLLFVLPFLFLFSAFFSSNSGGLALNLLCFGSLMLAAWLTRGGLEAQEAYEARKVSRRPAIPRKIFGSALTGVGLFLAGVGDGSFTDGIIYGVLGAALHSFSFGLDPLKDKGLDATNRFQTERVARAVSEAESRLKGMTEAISRTRDRNLEARVDKFASTARRMFRTVEEDPRDLTAARMFLGVYLEGAHDATTKFVEIYTRSKDEDARKDYIDLLDDLENNFAAKTETLLLDDRTDLNVEIDVLRERLGREHT